MQICNVICTILLDRKHIFDRVTIYYTETFKNQLGDWSLLLIKNQNIKTFEGFHFWKYRMCNIFLLFICIILLDSTYNFDQVMIHYLQIHKNWINGWWFLSIQKETLNHLHVCVFGTEMCAKYAAFISIFFLDCSCIFHGVMTDITTKNILKKWFKCWEPLILLEIWKSVKIVGL